MAKKPSYPRKEALQPMKRKAGLTRDRDEAQRDRDEAQRDKETGRGPQRKTENGPRKGIEASEIAWVHLSPSGDDTISLSCPICRALQLNKASAPGAQQLSSTSSTTLLRPCSLRVRSTQAIQPIRPQHPEPSSSV